MSYGNEVTLVGNVTREPELRYVPSGQAVAKFGLAWNNKYTRADGTKIDDAHYFDVTAWRELAENVVKSIPVGTRVIVHGRLNFEQWTTEDGSKRSRVSIEADSIGPDLRWATATVMRTERQTIGADEDWKAEASA